MANRQTLILDGIDIATKRVKLLDYTILNFAGYKDGGFKNPDGIDGVLDSPSSAMSGLTGNAIFIIEGETESEVNDIYRKFKQWIRSKSFWKISTKEDPNFYRLGKFLGEEEPSQLTEVPVFRQAWRVIKIAIQFKDGYEHSASSPEQSVPSSGILTIQNDGRATRDLKVTIQATSNITGYFRIEVSNSGSLVFGTDGSLMARNQLFTVDFGTFELLLIATNNRVTNRFSMIKEGSFFKVPSGSSTFKVQYKARWANAWTSTLPATVKIELKKSYY